MEFRGIEPETLLAVFLGASAYDESPKLADGSAFYSSANDFRNYLRNIYHVPRSNIKWLFDDSRSPSDQLTELARFLSERIDALKVEGRPAEDLLIYYVGHGLFAREQYCLAIRTTKENNEAFSSIRGADLAGVVKEYARFLRRFLIFDCCFSAAIYKEFQFQTPPLTVARAQVIRELPRKGTCLLCSSNADDPSLVSARLGRTMFSDALMISLTTGDISLGNPMSFGELGDLVRENLRTKYDGNWARPEVHSPDQREGDIAQIPIFPNPAYRAAIAGFEPDKLQQAERERQVVDEKEQLELAERERLDEQEKALLEQEQRERLAADEKAQQESVERDRRFAEERNRFLRDYAQGVFPNEAARHNFWWRKHRDLDERKERERLAADEKAQRERTERESRFAAARVQLQQEREHLARSEKPKREHVEGEQSAQAAREKREQEEHAQAEQERLEREQRERAAELEQETKAKTERERLVEREKNQKATARLKQVRQEIDQSLEQAKQKQAEQERLKSKKRARAKRARLQREKQAQEQAEQERLESEKREQAAAQEKPETLAKLKEGVEVWNAWRTVYPGIHPDLSGLNLRGANLQGFNLVGTDLRGSDLTGANLHGVDISEAIVGGTTFQNVDLSSVAGLEEVIHSGQSAVSLSTYYRSHGKIPESFLRGCRVPDDYISYMRSHVVDPADVPVDVCTCFISYSNKDAAFAVRVHAELKKRALNPWLDLEDLKIGDRFQERIEESIWRCTKLLVVLSTDSVNSQWVEREVQTAFEKERRQNTTVLLPVRLDDAIMESPQAWAAEIRRTRHIGDFRKWENHDSFQESLDRLIRDLKVPDSKSK